MLLFSHFFLRNNLQDMHTLLFLQCFLAKCGTVGRSSDIIAKQTGNIIFCRDDDDDIPQAYSISYTNGR